MAQQDVNDTQLNPRHRLVYIRQRLLELREERERLMSERNYLRSQIGEVIPGVKKTQPAA